MRLYDLKNTKFIATKTQRPKFKMCFGRTWDRDTKTIDGMTTEFFYDTTWGMNFYFVWDNSWYKARVFDIEERRELFTVPQEVINNAN